MSPACLTSPQAWRSPRVISLAPLCPEACTACVPLWHAPYLQRFQASTRQSLPPETKWLLSPVNFRHDTSW